MPELSRFFGIIIRMYSEPSERHNLAHFHAYYQNQAAVFSIFRLPWLRAPSLHGSSG